MLVCLYCFTIHIVNVAAVELLTMVDRLRVVLLSIVPTGAALVYLLWMFGWKKPRGVGSRHCQKPQTVEVTGADSNESPVKVDAAEQLLMSVNSEQDDATKNDVCTGTCVSDDVTVSPASVLKNPYGDQSISATDVTCEPSSDLAADVDCNSLDHAIAVEVNKCESVNVTASEDELLKHPSADSQENTAITFLEDDKCCNSCSVNGNGSGDKVVSDSGCVRNDVTSNGYENGRRDSLGSVSDFLSFVFSV